MQAHSSRRQTRNCTSSLSYSDGCRSQALALKTPVGHDESNGDVSPTDLMSLYFPGCRPNVQNQLTRGKVLRRNIMRPRMVLIIGTRLGPYEIQSPLGAGGMGEVYRALDTRLDRIVAVKILPSHLSEDSEAKERFD